MKIDKVSDEKNAPNWIFEKESAKKTMSVSNDILESVRKFASNINDEELSLECDKIEIAASKGEKYYYSSSIPSSVKTAILEYAYVCGMDKSNMVEIVDNDVSVLSDDHSKLVKTASVQNMDNKLVLNDPFHLNELLDSKDESQDDWQEVKAQSKLKDSPSILTNSVKPIRGGEDYNKSNCPSFGTSQNTISNPDQIKNTLESECVDNGVRIRAEKEAIRKQRDAENTEKLNAIAKEISSDKLMDNMRKKVFPTESLNAQSGLNSSRNEMGVYSEKDLMDMPEKTLGEKLSEKNDERRASIQRPKKEKVDLNVKSSFASTISDSFLDSLKTKLDNLK